MLSIEQLHEAVKGLLGERYAGVKVYRDLTPRDFQRPSFLAEYGPVEMEDAGAGLVMVDTQITVTAFVPVDGYHNSQVDALSGVVMKLLELFAVGCLQVGDRALRVTGCRGEYGFDYAAVTVSLSYADDRPGQEESFDLMGEVHRNITVKEE